MLVFTELIQDLLPAGVLNLITGSGSKSGQYLLEHPGLSKLAFTGSTEIGRDIAVAAAERLIPATLEPVSYTHLIIAYPIFPFNQQSWTFRFETDTFPISVVFLLFFFVVFLSLCYDLQINHF